MNAGEVAGRQLGQILVGLDTVTDAQHAVPIYRAAASLALWQGDHADAARAAARGWELVKGGGDWSLIAKMASTVAEVDFGRRRRRDGRRDLAALASIRARSKGRPAAARKAVERSGVEASIGSRREADEWLAQAAAHRERLEGQDDPETWDRLARSWAALDNPYEQAKARWHQAEAILGSGEGRASRGPRAARARGGGPDRGRPAARGRSSARFAELAGPGDDPPPAARRARAGLGRRRRRNAGGTGAKPAAWSPTATVRPLARGGPGASEDGGARDGARTVGRRRAEDARSSLVRGFVGDAPTRAGTRSGSRTASARSSR